MHTRLHTEVIEQTTPSGRTALTFVARALDYLFGLLYALLAIRLVLDFVDARRSAGFYRFIQGLSEPFYGPFKGIVGTESLEGGHIVWSLVVALVAYMVLHACLRGLLHLASRA